MNLIQNVSYLFIHQMPHFSFLRYSCWKTKNRRYKRKKIDGGMTKQWSVDPLEISLGSITRARAKRLKETLNVLIQDAQVESVHVLNSKEETKMVHVIKVNPELGQELGHFLV